jgi:hypothetical protein
MGDSPFMLRPVARAAPPGFPPDVAPNQIIYAAHINAIRDSVAVWPGNVDGNGKILSNIAAISVSGAITAGSLSTTTVEASVFRSLTDMTFQTGAAYPERMRITAAGSVGIATVSPVSNLHVSGAKFGGPSTSGSGYDSQFRVSAIGHGEILDIGVAGGLWLQCRNMIDYSVTYPLLLQPVGGKVGIGTTGPSNTLHVAAVIAGPPSLTYHDPAGMASFDVPGNVELAIGWQGSAPFGYWLQVRQSGLARPILFNAAGGDVIIGGSGTVIQMYLGGSMKTLSVDGSGFVKAA